MEEPDWVLGSWPRLDFPPAPAAVVTIWSNAPAHGSSLFVSLSLSNKVKIKQLQAKDVELGTLGTLRPQLLTSVALISQQQKPLFG